MKSVDTLRLEAMIMPVQKASRAFKTNLMNFSVLSKFYALSIPEKILLCQLDWLKKHIQLLEKSGKFKDFE